MPRRGLRDLSNGDRSGGPRVHFIGFRGEEYWSAVRIWGRPDFIWPKATFKVLGDCAPEDLVIFGPAAFDRSAKRLRAK